MNKPGASLGVPMAARVVHKSVLIEHPGAEKVIKLMLNVAPQGRIFEPGLEVGFAPSGTPPESLERVIRHYTIESVGEVPFEDTLDITLYVRLPSNGAPSSVVGRLGELATGDTIGLYGPFAYPFYPPMGSRSNMVLIGAGYGMVPFRWLAHKIHARSFDWMGKVLMLEGSKTGLEHLYLNDPSRDQDQFFDQSTYRAFEALKTRYSATALDREESAAANREALWRLLGQGSVYVYLAGYRHVAEALDEAMAAHLRIADRWHEAKAALVRDGHWLEHLYD